MLNIAVVGATGNVGREILRIVDSSGLKTNKVIPLASDKSVGKLVSFGDKDLEVLSLAEFNFNRADIVFFATGASVSKEYVHLASKQCKLVIDLSSYFRTQEKIPLIVPEVNSHDIGANNIISNPNCVVIQIATAMHKLHDVAEMKKIILSTYQSVSGAGKIAMDTLYHESSNKIFNAFSELDKKNALAFNLVPKIDEFTDSGYTGEEVKIMEEIKKIFGSSIEVSSTCVRVPVFVGHCISAHVEFLNDITAKNARNILEDSEGVIVADHGEYHTPLECIGRDEVFISRIRQDTSKSLNFWIVADNLRKGAALNAVQIAQFFIDKKLRI